VFDKEEKGRKTKEGGRGFDIERVPKVASMRLFLGVKLNRETK